MPPAPFPERAPRPYRRWIETLGPDHPAARVVLRRPDETGPDPDALDDPTGDRRLRPAPRIVQKHPDRVVLLAADRCFAHCRYCFRRTDSASRQPDRDLRHALEWIAGQPGIREVILSGGDPLTLPDRRLAGVGGALARIPHVAAWRIHTRAPVVAPARVTPGLAATLGSDPPARVVLHLAHPAELRPAVAGAVARLAAVGVTVENQTVLLRGVNDDPAVLTDLFDRLADLGVSTRYLHHPDRVRGNRAFRVSLRRGLAVHRALAARDRRPAPPYVVDLPNGAGKVPVAELAAVGEQRARGRRRLRYRWTRPPRWAAVVPDRTFTWWDVWEPARGDPP